MGVKAVEHANNIKQEVLNPSSHHRSTHQGHEEEDLEYSEPDQLPSFEFPTSPSDFVAFGTSPSPTSSFTPYVDAEPQSARLTGLIESWAPPHLSAGRIRPASTRHGIPPSPVVSSRTPATPLECDPFYDLATRNISSSSSRPFTPPSSLDMPQSDIPRRGSQTARYSTQSRNQNTHEPPLSPPPSNRWGAGSLADIAKRPKPKPNRNRPHDRAGSKIAPAVKSQYPPLEPKFDDWQTYGGEVTRGGRGGRVIKDDGWGAASVTVPYPGDKNNSQRRFGGW